MRVVYGFDGYAELCAGMPASVVSVGSFDGVHAGHRAIMQRMNEMRDALSVEYAGYQSVVVTFSPHPRQVILGAGDGFYLLTTLEERAALLESCGIDTMVVVEFNEEFKSSSAEQFFETLSRKLNMKMLIAGFNHHLGSDRASGLEQLSLLGEGYGANVEVMSELFVEDYKVSSSVVRRAVEGGDLKLSEALLRRNYFFIGELNGGLDFCIDGDKLLPPRGEYGVRVLCLDGKLLCDNAILSVSEGRKVSLHTPIEHISERLIVEFL